MALRKPKSPLGTETGEHVPNALSLNVETRGPQEKHGGTQVHDDGGETQLSAQRVQNGVWPSSRGRGSGAGSQGRSVLTWTGDRQAHTHKAG